MPAHSGRRLRFPAHARRAFTLVEMLVAMVLTLILVAAIAEFYARVGEAVKDGRAMIELSGSLRTVVQRLKSDLDQLTVPVGTWTDDAEFYGYFAIWEGPASDGDVNANFVNDTTDTVWTNDADSDGIYDVENFGVTSLLGDGDDALGMTIRATGEPFSGRYGGVLVPAQHAEVVWWTGFDDLDADGQWDLNEPRQIYRRQLLIRPDAAISVNPATGFNFNQAGWTSAQLALTGWWQSNDISASIRLEADNMGNSKFFIRANSLADLSRREMRFGNWLYDVRSRGTNPNTWGENFPYPTGNDRVTVSPGATALLPCVSAKSANLSPFVLNTTVRGEDIVLTNILALDVRVFDPSVPLRADATQTNLTSAFTALAPGDPGYIVALTDSGGIHPQVGTGAYVDLGYGTTLVQMLTRAPYSQSWASAKTLLGLPAVSTNRNFAEMSDDYDLLQSAGPPVAAPPPVYQPAGYFYDTWSLSYERDGIDQDDGGTLFDEGTNGIDDDNRNGVDDILEKETMPPFSKALRGVQVRIRVYEPGTRQMRQATVVTDFIQE